MVVFSHIVNVYLTIYAHCVTVNTYFLILGKSMSSVEEIIERMREVCGAKSDVDLAKYLGLSRSNAISSWKTRDSKPYTYCEIISQKEGVTIDWLLTGEGVKFKNDMNENLSDPRTLKTIQMIKQLPEEDQREILSRIEKLHAADLQSKKLSELTKLVEELRQGKTA